MDKYTLDNMFAYLKTWSFARIGWTVVACILFGFVLLSPVLFMIILWFEYTWAFYKANDGFTFKTGGGKYSAISNSQVSRIETSKLFEENQRKFGLQPYNFDPENDTPKVRPQTGSQFDVHARPTQTHYRQESIPMNEYNDNMPPIVAKEYAIVDLETTGLSPTSGDRIIEIAVMVVDAAYNVVGRYETLINPRRAVTLTHVHQITDSMVRNAPTIEEVNDDILALFHNRIVVAHNAGFEQKFLNAELNGRDLTANNFLDTLKYARAITPTENHKLGTIAEFYGVPYVSAHTAMGDVIITREVLSKMLPANPNSQYIASEDLTPYFHPVLGDTQPVPSMRGWVKR